MLDVSAGHSEFMSYIRATAILGMEVLGKLLGTLSLGLREPF